MSDQSQDVNWLKDCEICNTGLCIRMDDLRNEGCTMREAAKIMESEAAQAIGYPLWSASQIRWRYLYHKGKLDIGRKPTTESQQNQILEGIAPSLEELIDQGKTFGTIYADPPWFYQNQGTRGATSGVYKPGEWQMSIQELCELPIKQITSDKAHLHLWTTNAFLFECPQIMEAWGFEYKSVFVWVKPQMGIGNYWRVSHEFLVLGVKSNQVFLDKNYKSWLELRRGRHSQKPEEIAEIIEKVSPTPYLELFARRPRPNWTVWGNEIERNLLNYKIEARVHDKKG